MKTLFSLLFTVALATSAMAQGRVNFLNDSLHLVFWNPNCTFLWFADAAVAGHAYLAGDGRQSLTVELWAGSSSTSLSRQATTDFVNQAHPGQWVSSPAQMPSVGAGTNFFVIYIYDEAAGSYQNASTSWGHYFGTSGIFKAVAGGGTPYYSLTRHSSPSWSTWADGAYPLDADVANGARGTIMLGAIFLDGYQLPPTLNIQTTGPGQVKIDWDLQSFYPSTFYLQVNDSGSPSGWTDAPSGTSHPVTFPITGSAQFYRLIQRCP